MPRTAWNLDYKAPRAGTHYPSSTTQFASWFIDERSATAYLEAVRFRNGLGCVRCGVVGPRRQGLDGSFWCGACRRRFTVRTGTVLERTHVPLRTWLTAAWQLTNTKSGFSAVSLARSTGIHYETAWYLEHKLRAAMSSAGHARLRGNVELDETFVGGVARGAGSGGSQARESNKTTVIVAAERATETMIGRIRMARSYNATVLCTANFITENIEPGAILFTDGWPTYAPALKLLALEGLYYDLRPTDVANAAGHAHDHLFAVHRVASLLKRWLLGTYHGSVSEHQIDHYLDEFAFRFNRRSSSNRGLLFWRLVTELVSTRPILREEIDDRRAELAKADAELAKDIELYTQGADRRYRARVKAHRVKGIPVY